MNNQVSIVVPSDLMAWLDAYCANIGVKRSELVRLLIIREIRLQRLKDLDAPTLPRTHGDATVTAYFASNKELATFDAHALANKMTRRRAGLALVLQEQRERWLERFVEQA